jgi:hypothetical protein
VLGEQTAVALATAQDVFRSTASDAGRGGDFAKLLLDADSVG